MFMRRMFPMLLVAILLGVGRVAAQTPDTATAVANTPVYLTPDASRTPLRVAAQGTTFEVLGESGEWTQVRFRDPQLQPLA